MNVIKTLLSPYHLLSYFSLIMILLLIGTDRFVP